MEAPNDEWAEETIDGKTVCSGSVTDQLETGEHPFQLFIQEKKILKLEKFTTILCMGTLQKRKKNLMCGGKLYTIR